MFVVALVRGFSISGE